MKDYLRRGKKNTMKLGDKKDRCAAAVEAIRTFSYLFARNLLVQIRREHADHFRWEIEKRFSLPTNVKE